MIITEFGFISNDLETYSKKLLVIRGAFYVVFFVLILMFLFKENMNSF